MANEAVLDVLLRLPEEERAELASRLLDSLEDSNVIEPGHEAAWTEVIDRRVAEIREGRAQTVDGEQAMARVEAMIAARHRR